MKLTKAFWITLGIMLVIFVLPTISTYNLPYVDGVRIYGFPFVFKSEGGMCPPPGCGHSFSYLNIVLDLLILIAIPLIVNAIIIKVKHKQPLK